MELPEFVMTPIQFMGDASVPLVLIAFGMSFAGTRILGPSVPSEHSALEHDQVHGDADRLLVDRRDDLRAQRPGVVCRDGNRSASDGRRGLHLYQKYRRGVMIAWDTGLLITGASLIALLLVTLLLKPAA